MAHPLIKSIVWLSAFSGLGYILYVTCTPTEADIDKLRQTLPGVEKNKSEVLKKNEQLYKALQAATVEKPIYLLTKEDIKSDKSN